MTKPLILIVEKTPKNPALITEVRIASNLSFLGQPELLRIYNAATGRSTSKFASRPKGLAQTFTAIQELAAVDLRAEPPVLYRRGEALPDDVRPAPAPGSAPPDVQRAQTVVPGTTEEVTDQVIPASRPVGRPQQSRPARKQADGTYAFDIPARKQKAAPGGRRPDLIAQLRKAPTFRQLLKRFPVNGADDDTQAFNLAGHILCMTQVTGFGVKTEGGRLVLSEPLS